MVIMYFADARITCRGEFKARSDRTVDGPTSRAGITLVSLKRSRPSARDDAGRSAICLSSNRHDRGNEQQTSGTARLAGRAAVSARGGSKSKSSTRSARSADDRQENGSRGGPPFRPLCPIVGINARDPWSRARGGIYAPATWKGGHES